MIVGIRFTFFVYLVSMGTCVGFIWFGIMLVEKLYVVVEDVLLILPLPFSPLISYSLIFRRCYAFITSA